jgi:acyl-CoA dehydrogenase
MRSIARSEIGREKSPFATAVCRPSDTAVTGA